MRWLFLFLFSCFLQPLRAQDYSFFVAGHAYGNPITYQYGLHPPFVAAIDYINQDTGMALGVLTGDVVPHPTAAYWDSAQADIAKINVPVYIAPGNHDKGLEFTKRFKKEYYAFTKGADLFIILSPVNWSVAGKRKEFLEKTLKEKADSSRHIFVFCHELIWWAPDNQFKGVKVNYAPHYPGHTNYWDEIHPLFDSLPNQVILFAGDLGCVEQVSPYMYYQQDNVTLIANGMGGGKEDNIIVVEVADKISYQLIGINGPVLHNMGNLTEYKLPE